MTATYTFDVFASLDGFGSYDSTATGAATGASKAPSSSTTASPSTRRSSGWSSGPTRSGSSCSCWARAPRSPSRVTREHADEDHADNGGVDDARRAPRLAGRDPRER